MYTSKCKTELTIVEPEALPGAVCDSDDNLKCFCTEGGEKSDRTKKKNNPGFGHMPVRNGSKHDQTTNMHTQTNMHMYPAAFHTLPH